MQDRERELNERGIKDAEKLGRILKERGIVPDLIVSSPAVRAGQTAEAVCSGMGKEIETRKEEQLYFSSVEDYIITLAGFDDEKNRIMTVGHNPVTEDLISELTGKRLHIKTCNLCRILLDIKEWREVQTLAGSLEVEALITPG